MNFNYLRPDTARMNSDLKKKKKNSKSTVINSDVKVKCSFAISLKLKVYYY